MHASRSAVAVHERLRPHDLVLFAVSIVLVVALPWMLTSVGAEPVAYRDQRTLTDTTAPAWLVLIAFAGPFLVWPCVKLWNLLAKPAAATLGPGGLRLHDDIGGLYARNGAKAVDLDWSEVRQVVLWRKHTRWLGFLPGWTTQVGVVKESDWHQVSRREPTAAELANPGHRRDGSPIRLGAMLNSRSVRLGPRAFADLAKAAAQYAPQVAIVDERVFGRRRVIRPGT